MDGAGAVPGAYGPSMASTSPPPPPVGPAAGGAGAGAYRVCTLTVGAIGARVGRAADRAGDLTAASWLTGSAGRTGSAALDRAVAAFGQAWAGECVTLAHDARLLADALTAAARTYQGAEWAIGAALELTGAADAARR